MNGGQALHRARRAQLVDRAEELREHPLSAGHVVEVVGVHSSVGSSSLIGEADDGHVAERAVEAGLAPRLVGLLRARCGRGCAARRAASSPSSGARRSASHRTIFSGSLMLAGGLIAAISASISAAARLRALHVARRGIRRAASSSCAGMVSMSSVIRRDVPHVLGLPFRLTCGGAAWASAAFRASFATVISSSHALRCFGE
jgi:hypothetical protein